MVARRIGWLNTREYLETGDYESAQAGRRSSWDTNGNGVRDDFVGANEAPDPAKDTDFSVGFGFYSVNPAPDGSVWGTILGYPGAVIRLVPGDNPAETAITEYYELPVDENGDAIEGFSPRGGDVDRDGVMWVALASGHMASFDRRKCGRAVERTRSYGQHCAEGWTFYTSPCPSSRTRSVRAHPKAPTSPGSTSNNTLGLGENTPINTGNQSGSAPARPGDGEWVRMRVPYPLGFTPSGLSSYRRS